MCCASYQFDLCAIRNLKGFQISQILMEFDVWSRIDDAEMPLFLYLKEFLYFQYLPKLKENTIGLSIT